MKENFVQMIKEAGIIGAGGAGFPTHVKMNAQAEYIIVNGAECEPLLKVDQQLMATHSEKLLKALDRVVLETKAKKGIVALKQKYKEAVENLSLNLKDYEKLDLFTIDNFYPAGDEQVLVYEVLKRVVPSGGIPLDVGVIVINVETLLNIYHAMNDEKVTHKYVTVTGEVKKPITIKVPVGISVSEAIDLAGGATIDTFKVIDGGPMMGKLIDDTNRSIKKNTKGLIVLPKDHLLVRSKERSIEKMLRQARSVCCHCSLCTQVCPRNLLGHSLHPDKLMRLASYKSTCDSLINGAEAFLCSECGLCEQVCVMGLQPFKLNQLLKSTLRAKGIKNSNHPTLRKPHPFRAYRKFPINKLKARLGIEKYDEDAPLTNIDERRFLIVSIDRLQHIGARVEPTVKIGDKVHVGDLIGKVQDNQLGAKIHASIDGIIKDITEEKIIICREDPSKL